MLWDYLLIYQGGNCNIAVTINLHVLTFHSTFLIQNKNGSLYGL